MALEFSALFNIFAFWLNDRNSMSQLNQLKAVLAVQNESGKWLAGQLGKSTCTISKWCKNSVLPDLNTLAQIAQCLNVKVW